MNVREYLFCPGMTGEHRMPARTLLVPAQKRGVTHANVTESDRVQLLSGKWKFRYLPEDTEEAFYLPETDDGDWDRIPVPGMWQFCGYGTCLYPNLRYVFPYDPPYIHRDNPVGLYRRHFTAHRPEGRAFLRFLGVDNAYFVWLNGGYVGFSKGSRIPAEFDVTELLRDGENVLAVKVFTYSDASYLENQDMLLASGIFRDVKLIYTGKNALWDYTLLPSPQGFRVRFECLTDGGPTELRFTLCGADGTEQAKAEVPLTGRGEIFLPLGNAVLWNAEEPYLYTLYIELAGNGEITETHTKKAGIALSEVRGNRLTLNGSPITLKGVNRHENNCDTGRAITAHQIKTELTDIKQNHLNAIRCSHYTNQPVFYELCSELGIYVMDEADCESHGAETSGDQGALNKDPKWFPAFFDRISRMYLINKNETCINIWSLGNEAGTGQNHVRCADWLTEQDVKKPIKDMSECHPENPQRFELTGYMPMQTLYDTEKDPKYPLMLVEYGHAMGNSPSALEDVWDWIYDHGHCCGGYVWEYKSHGFYVPGKNGRARYLYGGDFPDDYHWSNFSLDGYHTSCGTAKPTWRELGEVSAPVAVRWAEDGVTVVNTCDFKPLDGVTLHWSVRADGKSVRRGEIPLDGIQARERRFFPLPLDAQGIPGTVTADCEFTRGFEVLAYKQKILKEAPDEALPAAPFAHTVAQEGDAVTVTGDDFAVTVQKGLICRVVKDGITLLDAPMRLNCMRAPTDNDGIVNFDERLAGEWKERLVHTMRFGCYRTQVQDAPEGVTLTAEGRFLPTAHWWGFDTRIVYTVSAGGATRVEIDLRPYGRNLPRVLPRVGVYFTLDGAYGTCRWLGRGPEQNYPDCKANAPFGRYREDVENMNFLFDVPQETGSRQHCREVTVSGGEKALTVRGRFAFAFQDFTPENLREARHYDELEKCSERYLYIDHVQRGLGSNSCGPQPEEEYELPTGAFHWFFDLLPGGAEGGNVNE